MTNSSNQHISTFEKNTLTLDLDLIKDILNEMRVKSGEGERDLPKIKVSHTSRVSAALLGVSTGGYYHPYKDEIGVAAGLRTQIKQDEKDSTKVGTSIIIDSFNLTQGDYCIVHELVHAFGKNDMRGIPSRVRSYLSILLSNPTNPPIWQSMGVARKNVGGHPTGELRIQNKGFNEGLTEYICCKVLLEYYKRKFLGSKSGKALLILMSHARKKIWNYVRYPKECENIHNLIMRIDAYGEPLAHKYNEETLLHAYFSGGDISSELYELFKNHNIFSWNIPPEDIGDTLNN